MSGEMADWQLENMAMPDDDSQEEETTLTHQERAERAASLLFKDPPPSKPWVDQSGRIIAREMFPAELVEAARNLYDQYEFFYLVKARRTAHRSSEWEALRNALDLYPEPEEETDRER